MWTWRNMDPNRCMMTYSSVNVKLLYTVKFNGCKKFTLWCHSDNTWSSTNVRKQSLQASEVFKVTPDHWLVQISWQRKKIKSTLCTCKWLNILYTYALFLILTCRFQSMIWSFNRTHNVFLKVSVPKTIFCDIYSTPKLHFCEQHFKSYFIICF